MLKLKLNEKNKLSSAVLLILLVLIIGGVLCFMIFGLRYFELLQFPQFIENLFYKSDNAEVQFINDDRSIYNFLTGTEEDNPEDDINAEEIAADEIYEFNIALENIREVLESIVLPDNIYIESRAEYRYKNEVSKIVETSLWKKGEKYRYLVKVNSINEILYINDGKREYIKDFTADTSITKEFDELFSFVNIPNIPDINYYLDLIEDAEITNYTSVEADDNENIARIKYKIPGLDQRENIFISLDTGIVLAVRSEHGQNVTYYEYNATVKEAYNDGAEISKTEIVNSLFVIGT